MSYKTLRIFINPGVISKDEKQLSICFTLSVSTSFFTFSSMQEKNFGTILAPLKQFSLLRIWKKEMIARNKKKAAFECGHKRVAFIGI